MIILSFDISSNTIGWSVLEKNINGIIKSITYSYIKPNKKGNIFSRLHDTQKQIIDILNKYNPDVVAIEEIISYMPGASTANTIIMLTTFNRMIGLTVYNTIGKLPFMLSVMAIRHGLKIGKEFPSKEDIPKLLEYHIQKFKHNILVDKHGKPDMVNYDMADAIAVGLFAFKKLDQVQQEIFKYKKIIETDKKTTPTDKKRLKKAKQEYKELTTQYKEITGSDEYSGSI